ncbi:ABC transporter permease subunit [Herbiconiux moechotypicola]|nr:ABC transporter permease subunit [Herbiconiux moechotypicola]MCS5729980.1 ABC transporter permease subunit [Herbiconiux moechotypicola]
MSRGVAAALRQLLLIAVSAVAATGLWIAVLESFRVSPLLGARPWAVWAYLSDGAEGAGRRAVLLGQLGETLAHASVGLLAAMVSAFLLAAAFAMVQLLETALTPLLLVLRTVPVVVLTPVITIVVGNGLGAVVVIVFLAVFFPCVFLMLQGMRSARREQLDLLEAYGSGSWGLLVRLRLPAAVPSISASFRVAIPIAVTGAMLAEWLATGDGLGGAISRASGSFDYTLMWSAMVLITVVTAVAYASATVLDEVLRARFGQLGDG